MKLLEYTSLYISKHPKRLLLGSIFTFLTSLLFLPGITSDFSTKSWLWPDDPHVTSFNQYYKRYGVQRNFVVLLESPNSLIYKKSLIYIDQITEQLKKNIEVVRVDSITNYNNIKSSKNGIEIKPIFKKSSQLNKEGIANIRDLISSDEDLIGHLINKELNTTLIIATLAPNYKKVPNYTALVNRTKTLLAEIENIRPAGITTRLTGSAYIFDAFKTIISDDMSKIVPLTIGLSILILFLLLGSFTAIGSIVLAITISISLTLSIASIFLIPMNAMTINVPQILFCIGIADALHILIAFRNLQNSSSKTSAEIVYTIVKDEFPALLLTSISTAIGFVSLYSSPVASVAQMGLLAGIGAVIALIITLSTICPMLTLRWITFRKVNKRYIDKVKSTESRPLLVRMFLKLQPFRTVVLILFSLLIVLSIYLLTNVNIDNSPMGQFSEKTEVAQTFKAVKDKFHGLLIHSFEVDSGSNDGVKNPEFLKKVDDFQSWMVQHENISKTVSITTILKKLNQALHEGAPAEFKIPESRELVQQELFLYDLSLPEGMSSNDRISADGRYLRMSFNSDRESSEDNLNIISQLITEAESRGLSIKVGGEAQLYLQLHNYIVPTFLKSLLLSILFISLGMALIFKSIKVGFVSALANTLPVIFVGAGLTLIGRNLDIGSVIVASICFGIAIDDTIHILSHFISHQRRGFNKTDSVIYVLKRKAPVLISTTLLLAIGFLTYLLASFIPNMSFGVLCALILTLALVIDLTLVPLLLAGQSE